MIGRASFAACLMLAGNMASAHHSPVNFDLDVTDFAVSGTIRSLSFRNPHSVIELEVPSPDGQITQWYIEFSSVNLLLRRDWDLDRIAAGISTAALAEDARLAGIWLPDAGRSQRMPPDPPYIAEGRRIVDDWRASHDPIEDDPGAFCQAPGMPTLALGGADYPVEIVVTPEQITILMELHQQVRRIFMTFDKHPERLFPQRNGHSVGHWEAETLVVDTSTIRAITFGAVPHSDRVHVVERWNAIDAGASLVNELTFTDPVMYAEPVTLRQVYTRAEPGARMLEYECTEGMWEDHERERERRQAAAAPVAQPRP